MNPFFLHATMHLDSKPLQDFLRPSFKNIKQLCDLGGTLSSRTNDQLGFPISAYNLCAERYFHSPSSVNRNLRAQGKGFRSK
jgi:hypothetical protein